MFTGDLPKHKDLLQVAQLCLSDSSLIADQPVLYSMLTKSVMRIRKNCVNPNPLDVAVVMLVTNYIATEKKIQVPEGSFGKGERLLG
jgi:hypothetical protein